MKPTFAIVMLFVCSIVYSTKAQEVQVPIDQDGKIDVINPELRQKLEMFIEINDFREARLYQTSDSLFILEITYQQGERSMRKREQMNVTQVADFRKQVSDRIHRRAPRAALDQSGRTKLMTSIIGLSLGFYGWAVPVMLEPNDDKVGVGLYLLTSGGVYLYANGATEDIEINDAAATAFQYGSTRGIVHSAALYGLLAGSESKIRWSVPISAIGSALEGIGVMSYVQKNKLSLGYVSAKGTAEDFGIGIGVGLAYLIRSGDQFDIQSSDIRLLSGMTLVGAGVGYIAGNLLTANTSYSSGDADILQTTVALGTSVAFTIADLAGVEKRKSLITVSMLGATSGLVVGHSLTGGRDFSNDAGTSIRLLTSAGVVLGLGTAYIIAEKNADRTIYLSLASLGAISGFTIAYAYASREMSTANQTHSWNIHFDPLGFTSTFYNPLGKKIVVQVPTVMLEYRF